MIAATALLAVGVGLAIGVMSAWQSITLRVDESLRPGRSVIGSWGTFGRGLLIAQVALTMTLLVTDPQPLVVFRPIVPGVDVAALSVYYPTRARTREIGVRVALGATRRTVVWMIVRDGLAIAVQGVLIGGLCSWAAARLVRAQLYRVAPGDPRTLLMAAGILLATVLASSLLPALRASRVVPLDALREE